MTTSLEHQLDIVRAAHAGKPIQVRCGKGLPWAPLNITPKVAFNFVNWEYRIKPERAGLPRITHVAVQYAGRVWALPAPNRHHDVIRHIASETGDGIRGPDVQGFVDDAGRFLRRAQAYSLAARNGQLNRRPGGYQGTDLYSEDLW